MRPFIVHTSIGPLRFMARNSAHALEQAAELAPGATLIRAEAEGEW